ncbi:hypothetical protein [Algoriphagus litoralis]|uniref:hypothetical protein n=1 Tax=Algoriphagus litoralis TaxID=2202829 RepID=UPI000DBA1DA0|nr:hypothetical protein [Algoriphagus litoralis]
MGYVRLLFLFQVLWLVIHGNAQAQNVLLHLRPNSSQILNTKYKIQQTVDLRIQKSKIGEVFNTQGVKIPVRIQGDLTQSALLFFQNSTLSEGNENSSIQVRIYEINLNERFDANKKVWKGEIQLLMGFFALGSFDPEPLLDYSGKIEYTRSSFTMVKVEEVMNRLFFNGLRYFDSWFQENSDQSRPLAKSAKLEFIETLAPPSDERLYYDRNRPLSWDDFKDLPSPRSKFNATIFVSFSVQGISLMEAGTVVQTVEVGVYMVPNQSWVKDRSEYGLNHEQRHFDLGRIVADRMIHRLKSMEIEPDWYQAKINEEYLNSYREMNRFQQLYDSQTSHGLDKIAQAKWNDWIEKGLKGDWIELENLLTEN